MLGLKKWIVLGVLLGTGCSDVTAKRREEIKNYKTTKVEVGIDNLSKRFDKCDVSDGELSTLKQSFSKPEITKRWVGSLNDISNLDNIGDEDWARFQEIKQRISNNFDTFYQVLERVKC